jgi:hypothetical protein
VGEKRTTGVAPSAPTGAEETGEGSSAGGGTTVADGEASATTVSDGDGAGFDAELQPGLAKIRINAKAWMPTTTPKILRIFMGASVGGGEW